MLEAELGTLQAIAGVILGSDDVDQVLVAINDRLLPMLDADVAGALLVEGDELVMKGGVVRCRAATARECQARGLAARVLATGRPEAVEDSARDEALAPDFTAPAAEQPLRSALAVPLWMRGELIGVLEVARLRASNFTGDDVRRLQAVATLAAIAIDNAHLAESRSAARRELETSAAERTAELRRSEAYLAEAQRLTHTGSFAIDASTRVVTHSSAEHSRLYGFDPAHPTPPLDEFFERIHPDDRARCVAALQTGIREGTNLDVEYRVVRGQPPVRHLHAIAHPVFTASGEVAEIVGTIVDVTEQRRAAAELERLASEQAALRRVAMLVAQESPPAEVLAQIVEEAANVLGDVECSLFRDEGDGTATVVALWGPRLTTAAETGVHFPTDGDGVVATVLREGRPHRINDYSAVTGAIGRRGRDDLGIRSAVGCPIVVRGRVWGAMGAARYEPESFPPETETRLARFAELAATAVANAGARAEVERLAEEQAAQRRVAVLVAEGASPTAVFDAVAAEIAALLGAYGVTMCRYEPGGRDLTVVGHRGPAAWQLAPGTRIRHDDPHSASAIVRRCERPARVDSYANTHGSIGDVIEQLTFRSGVGVPIFVDGRLWGVTIANWTGEDPPPRDTEQRMTQFGQLLDTAIANADSRDQLTASRARLVAAGDEARRQVVRDLHDGAQQRLVHTILTLKLAQRALHRGDGDVESLVGESLAQAERANAELRELAHGILPAVLARGGLRAGVEAVVARLDLPVRLDLSAERFPAEIEASAYFIVAEALTNVVKHAQAERAEVRGAVEDGVLRVEVSDDGIGGADPAGQGLVGISDRATALGGRLTVESPRRGGTRVSATLPVSVG